MFNCTVKNPYLLIIWVFDSRTQETLYKNLKNVFNLSEVGKAINYVELFSK